MRRLLFVDDDSQVLAGYARLLRRRYDLQTATSGREALDLLSSSGPFALVLADLQMPGMTGIELLRQVRQIAPDTVRLVLTGTSDIAMAIDAINEGSVFRFLTKPVSEAALVAAIDGGLQQHALQTAERELLERTLTGCVRVLTEVLSLANPAAFLRALRVRRIVHHLCETARVDGSWEFDLAAMLCQLGRIAVPGELLDASGSVVETMHASVAQELLAEIPRLESVAAMVARQGDPFLAADVGVPPGRRDAVRLGGHLLRVALDYDRLMSGGRSHDEAVAALRQEAACDPFLVDALEGLAPAHGTYAVKSVGVGELREGMVLQQEVCTTGSVRVAACGDVVTAPLLARLQVLSRAGVLCDTMVVLAPAVPAPLAGC
jgi:response regulator RpfG family c-di-GMP phosphodiesterase